MPPLKKHTSTDENLIFQLSVLFTAFVDTIIFTVFSHAWALTMILAWCLVVYPPLAVLIFGTCTVCDLDGCVGAVVNIESWFKSFAKVCARVQPSVCCV